MSSRGLLHGINGSTQKRRGMQQRGRVRIQVNLIKAVFFFFALNMSNTFTDTSPVRLSHTRKQTNKHTTSTKPWPRWTKAISGSTLESGADENTKKKQKTSKDQTTEWKSNSTPKCTYAHLFSSSRLCWETHWKTERDKATRDDHCDSQQSPNPGLSRSFSLQLLSVLASGWRIRDARVWPESSHDSHRMTDGAAVLLIDILLGCGVGLGPWLLTAICCCSVLLLLGHKEAQCQADEAEWSSQAAGPHSLSQTATAHIPSFKWTAELREASGQVRQTQACWETGRNGRMERTHCSFSRRSPPPDVNKLRFALQIKQSLKKYHLAFSSSLYVSCSLLLFHFIMALSRSAFEVQTSHWEFQLFVSHR